MRLQIGLTLALLATGCGSSADPPDIQPPADAAQMTAAPTTAVIPAAPVSTAFRSVTPTSFVPGGPASSPTTLPTAGFDYLQIATAAAETTSTLGDVVWLKGDTVPLPWIEDGFPGPSLRYEYDLAYVYEGLDDGYEVFPVGGEFVALGSSAGFGGAISLERSGRSVDVDFDAYVPVREVWTRPPEQSWTRVSASAFDAGTLVAAHPLSIGYRDGLYVVVGGTVEDAGVLETPSRFFGMRFGAEFDLAPAAWASTDLQTWIPLSVEFAEPGTHTKLTSVSVSQHGWVIAGIRWTEDGPNGSEWVGWASPDGVGWEPLPFAEVFGDPWCTTRDNDPCTKIYATMFEDAIVVYTWQWRWTGFNRSTWDMWIGVLESA